MSSQAEDRQNNVAGFNHGQLTAMAMGYMRSYVLSAAARLDVADALGERERAVTELAQTCGANPDALYRLLRALASFGVVAETHPERFTLTPMGKPLRKDVSDSEWNAIVFWADLLADSWTELTECVRTGESAFVQKKRLGLPSRWSSAPDSDDIFRSVMGTAPAEDYSGIVRAWDFSHAQVVADLGGGGGGLIAAVLHAFAHLRGMLVDRPETIDRARPHIEREFGAAGESARCTLYAADLCAAVPAGAEVYLLKHVLHGYRDEAAIGILRNCRAALPPQGRLLILEFVLPDTVPAADQALEHRLMSDLNMLAVTGGRERSDREWRALLTAAGLACQSIQPVPGDLVSVIEAAQD